MRESMSRLGQLGCTPAEARERLKRLLNLGLKDVIDDATIPAPDAARGFVKDMSEALRENPNFEPTFGQVTYAQDLYDRYIL